MNAKLAALGAAIVVIGLVLADSLYTVNQNEQALVLQFGEVVKIESGPGLKFKLPLVQNVQLYEKRVLDVDPPVEQVILSDQRRLDVGSYARYRIADPLLFFQSVRNETIAGTRINSFVNNALRNVLGNYTQLDVLSEQRGPIMRAIRDSVEANAKPLGIEIVDVRIVRADVPEGTVQSVYNRMTSEREREAAQYRAQGQEYSLQIRSRADRDVTVLLAEAERKAQELRGQGDAEAIKVQAAAYGADPQFFSFYRSLQAYQNALGSTGTTLVLSPKGDFFKYFNDATGRGLVPAVTQATPQGAVPEIPAAPAPAPVEPAPAPAPAPVPAPGSPG
ncbi:MULTISPECIES: protease modulator HflC [Inquilinus]|uniref:Protein HflC n=1 Tax=Inquilinus ginsengisoli TaxID=363840 RepID=A0ABU1JIZ1_9PROT|nr:protease modulator HflC [Inquilinus ginsengisoli]MDR6288568.1 membrane protease subunit HflC [Inquilinus ginsengisoli]